MARRETGQKRSIHVVCEHFEPFCNAARGVWICCEIGFSLTLIFAGMERVMSKFRWFVVFATVLSVVAFLACDPIDDGYDYYSLSGSRAVSSCRVYYPSSLENDNDTYPAVTLSGGMANSKEAMYWMAEYLAGQAEVIVFTISAANNMTVNGYENAHHDGYAMMVAENDNPSSVLYQRIKNYGLMGYSMGGGGVINVASDLGDDVTAVIAMAPYNPEAILRNVSAGCLIMVGSNDAVARARRNAEPAYEDLPDSIDKCLLEFRSFGHLAWVRNTDRSGDLPKELAGDWIDFMMNMNASQRSSFANPSSEVILNWNNL
jgi:dienelactone hydrolase